MTIALAARNACGAANSTDRDLLLEVVVNGQPVGMVAEFHQHEGRLYATRIDLDHLGLKVSFSGVTASVSLEDLTGVTYRLEERTQTIYISASRHAVKPTLLRGGASDATSALPVESGLGAALNYNIVGTTLLGRSTVAEGLLDARVFSEFGVADSSWLGITGGTALTSPVIRLDTTYTYSDPESERRYRAGDVISGGLSWTRPVRLAGVQVSTDFSIRPDLVTFPTPTIAGQVAVPSSVDVLVNGVQLLSRDVPPGPFQISELPIVTGAGDVSVVVRNAIGEQTTQTLPIYASSLLLAPGLCATSAELGVVRLNYGSLSNDYHASVGSISYRRGVSDWLTLEGHAEGSSGGGSYAGIKTDAGGMVGGGAAFTVGKLGVISLDAAGSTFAGRGGGLAAASFERLDSTLSVAASVQMTTDDFGDVASAYGDPVPRLQTRASVGLALGSLGSLGIAFVGVQRRASQTAQTILPTAQQSLRSSYGLYGISLTPASRVAMVSASYSRSVLNGRAFFYATGFRDLASNSTFGAVAGLTFPLGRNGSGGVSAGGGGGGSYATIQATKPAVEVGDVGWQLQESAGEPSRQLAIGEYKSPWMLVDTGIDRTSSQTLIRASAQGALAYLDGRVFVTNTIPDSFAVVDTGEASNVQVLQENRPVGRTGSSGLLLVPDLRSFDINRLAIEPTDVPIDSEVGATARLVRPQDRSGVIVHSPSDPAAAPCCGWSMQVPFRSRSVAPAG